MWKEIGIIVGLVICLLAIQKLGRRHGDESRSARLMKKYKTLTPDLLADTPDEELVEAVVACVLAEAAESRKPDPAYTLSKWPQPFTVVYSIWAVCKELAHSDYAALTRTATREMVEPAADGLPVVGAPKTAAALTALAEAYKADGEVEEAARIARGYLQEGMSPSEAAKQAAADTGLKKGAIYRLLLNDKEN